MTRKLLWFTAVMALLSAAFSIGVMASDQVNIIVNGKKTDVEAKVINDTTYVPIRAVAELLGAKIGWDGNTNSVIITGEVSKSDGAPPVLIDDKSVDKGKTGYSRRSPADLGVKLPFQANGVFGNFEGTVSVDQVIRGEGAWEKIKSANMFNDQPKDGYDYMLAEVSISITKTTEDDSAVNLSTVMFTLVSTDGKEYENLAVVTPDPTFDGQIYSGAGHTGWVAFEVKKDDPNPLIAFNRNYDGSGGLWFKTAN